MAKTRLNIDFMGKRNFMFAFSGLLLAISIAALLIKGLTFGVEFSGGTIINVSNSGTVTETQIRSEIERLGIADPRIQSTSAEGVNGFIIRTSVTDPAAAAADANKMADTLGISRGDVQATTIGAGWGSNITNAAILALALSIGAILLYISVRFEYKMSFTAVLALFHDVLIVLGVYSLAGEQVSPNTVAALLTILGYSLYDTIVVFHRVKENAQSVTRQRFMDMANESVNEVFVRSLNTTITSLIPVVVMLFMGGESLHDFAFALTIGLAIGAYSSIGVATPLYAMWKETEPKFAALKAKYAK